MLDGQPRIKSQTRPDILKMCNCDDGQGHDIWNSTLYKMKTIF
jgi:hypothetical protein